MEHLLFPMDVLRVTQGYGLPCEGVPADTYSHAGAYALDLGGADTGGDWLYAPCDMTVKRVHGSYNAVWFESDQVLPATGTKVVMLCLHINNADKQALGLRAGRRFKAGERCYREGRAGQVTGTHVHLELGKGPFRGTGWHRNKNGVWQINDPLIPHRYFHLGQGVSIVDGHGYAWLRDAGTPRPQTAAPAYKAGQRVTLRPDRIQTQAGKRWGPTYTGGRFRLWYPVYTVHSVAGDRVVLAVGGTVAAAVRADDLQPA